VKGIAYARVSTEEQASNGVSLDLQEARLRAYAEAKEWIVACGRDSAPEEFEFGYFDELTGRIELDQEKIHKLHSFNVLQYPECQECFCKYHCAGDCPDRRLADRSDCSAIRRIARQVLTDIADGRQQAKSGVTDTGIRQ